MGKARRQTASAAGARAADSPVVGLRIIGGSLRGRKLQYSGDLRTRPMKDRVREAVFNLIGPRIAGTHAIDLFAGTGALGLEAISRGAARATFIERHLPTLELLKQNAAALGVAERCEARFGDAFLWSKSFAPGGAAPLVVFCSPPFEFYVARRAAMLDLIARWMEVAPPGSLVVVEADEQFDLAGLPAADAWDARVYAPAVVAMYDKSD
jgi:16S rRNA (guanine966-N2)-methyltransferase